VPMKKKTEHHEYTSMWGNKFTFNRYYGPNDTYCT